MAQIGCISNRTSAVCRVLTCAAIGSALFGPLSSGATAATRRHLMVSVPRLAIAGQTVKVKGRVTVSLREARAVLQRRAGDGTWFDVASTRIHGTTFVLRWFAGSSGHVTLRVAIIAGNHQVETSPASLTRIGRRPEYCQTPVPQRRRNSRYSVVEGGLVDAGGPLSGSAVVCASSAYTVTISTPAGVVVDTIAAQPRHGFVASVPAGRYVVRVKSNCVTAPVEVKALKGRTTYVNVTCNVP